ncbi:hypothetical protein KPB2_5356 [Klebsiella pneumoniae Kb677]|nr:hypothetical protein KPB2_5356 [Klebsiella pneumoniae Kb677]
MEEGVTRLAGLRPLPSTNAEGSVLVRRKDVPALSVPVLGVAIRPPISALVAIHLLVAVTTTAASPRGRASL